MGKGGEAVANISTKQQSQSQPQPRKITWGEVQGHREPSDAWMVHQNRVYDVSNWNEHPGGAVIFTHAGDDMTDIFAAFHAPGSSALMKQFYIGDLVREDDAETRKDAHQEAFERGYRDLRSKLVLMGMFKSNPWFYLYKCVSNQVLWGTALAMVYYSDSVSVHAAAACLLGLFFQQCGWLAHDFLHHQVFKNRVYGDYCGIYWGNLMQGYSVQWWKNKHNGHHAVPNLHNSTATSQDGDPDIDTMRHQAAFYFPILLLARLSWLNESFKTAFGLGAASENAALELKAKGLQYPVLEKAGILLHYGWVIAVSSGFGRFSLLYSTAFFLLMTCSCGLMLALVFGLGHNGMAVYDADKRPDFWKLQVTTTRNITGGHGFPQAFVDWFCGGLQYQVDHHLFPGLPRHNLKRTHDLVKSFCREWNVQYHEADLVDGTVEVLNHLATVSDQFVLDFVLDGPTM
jgi:acyl-lipid Delta6-acetylenase / acyl-lipid (9-3)-desaturase